MNRITFLNEFKLFLIQLCEMTTTVKGHIYQSGDQTTQKTFPSTTLYFVKPLISTFKRAKN